MAGVGTSNPFALLGGESEKPAPKQGGRAASKSNKGRNVRPGKREFDRRGAPGSRREPNKKGHGKGGWGKNDDFGAPNDGGGRGRNRGGGRGRGRGRGGRGRGRGRGRGAAPAGDAKDQGEVYQEPEYPGENEPEVDEDPDNFTLDEYFAGLSASRVEGDKISARAKGSDNSGFKSGAVKGKKVNDEVYMADAFVDEGESKSKGSKKKKKGKKVLNMALFNETVKPSRKGGKPRSNNNRGGRSNGDGRGRGRGNRQQGRGRGRGRGAGASRGRGGPRSGGRAPKTTAQDEFPTL